MLCSDARGGRAIMGMAGHARGGRARVGDGRACKGWQGMRGVAGHALGMAGHAWVMWLACIWYIWCIGLGLGPHGACVHMVRIGYTWSGRISKQQSRSWSYIGKDVPPGPHGACDHDTIRVRTRPPWGMRS